MTVAVYAGSFDPLTNGHINIIRRGLRVFDKVIVAVANNASKQHLFTTDERLNIIHQEFGDTDQVEVDTITNCLLVDYTQRKGARVILRGLRAVSDFEYELQMTNMNRSLKPSIETVFMMADESTFYVSSRLVKEVAGLGGDISHCVPSHVASLLMAKLSKP